MLEQRIQQSAERLLEDTRLTDKLDDAEASRLLDWGIKVARTLCEQTGEMDDIQAEEFLYQPEKNLRKLLRGINKIAGAAPGETDVSLTSELEKLFASAAEVSVLETSLPNDLLQAAQTLSMLPASDRLSLLLSYFESEGNLNV